MLLILRVLQQGNELSAVELAGKVKRGTPGIILGGGIGPASQKAPDVIQTIDQHGMVQGGGSLMLLPAAVCSACQYASPKAESCGKHRADWSEGLCR